MDDHSFLAPKPFQATWTICCSLLFTDWFLPLSHTLMTLLVALPSKCSGAQLTHHFFCYFRCLCDLLITQYDALLSTLLWSGGLHVIFGSYTHTQTQTHTQTHTHTHTQTHTHKHVHAQLYIHAHVQFTLYSLGKTYSVQLKRPFLEGKICTLQLEPSLLLQLCPSPPRDMFPNY